MTVHALSVDLSKRFGGATVRSLTALKHMERTQVGFAALTGSAALAHAQGDSVTTHAVGDCRADPRIAGRIADIIHQHRYDVIDTHNVQSKLWGSLAVRRTGVAFVSTLNSWYRDEHGGSLKGRIYQAIDNITNTSVDMFIVVSEPIRRRLLEQGISDDRIALVPNAVSIDSDSVGDARPWLTQMLSLSPGDMVCCSVGRLVDAKGYGYLIQAAAQLLKRHPQLRFIVVGDGKLRAALQRQINDAGIGDQFRLLGGLPRDEALSLVKACDLFVMPSITEGTPIALLEAAALARPIIASEVGGIPRVIQDGKHGRLVRPGQVTSLVRAIEIAISSLGSAQEMAGKAQQRIHLQYSTDAQVSGMTTAYQRAVELKRLRND